MAVSINQQQRPQQDQESDLDKIAKLIQIGASGYGVYDAMGRRSLAQDQAARDKTIFDQQQEYQAKMKDINSPLYKAAQSAYAQAGVKVDPNVSMYDAKQLYGDAGDLLKAKVSAQSKHTGLEGLMAQERLLAMQRAANEARMPSQKQLDEIQQFDDSINSLQDIMGAARPNYVGPLTSKVPDMLVSGDEAAFRSKVGRYSDAYRKMITGAGAGDKELAKLEGRLVGTGDLPENFMGKGNDLLKGSLAAKARYLDMLSKTGKDISKYQSGEFKPMTMVGMKPTPKEGNGTPIYNIPTANAAPSAQDAQAIQWAKQNPNDPRAAQILQANGVR